MSERAEPVPNIWPIITESCDRAMVSNAGAHPSVECLPASPQAGEALALVGQVNGYPLYCCYFTGHHHCPRGTGVVGKIQAEPVVC